MIIWSCEKEFETKKKCTLNEKFVIISKLDQEKSLNKHKAFKVTKKEKIKNKKVQKY